MFSNEELAKIFVAKEYADKISIYPVGHRIIVIPDKKYDTTETEEGFEEYSSTKDGPKILIAKTNDNLPSYWEREQASSMNGTVIAVGGTSFKDFADGKAWYKPGQKIIFARHAGKRVMDTKLGKEVLIMEEKDVASSVHIESAPANVEYV